MEKTAQVVWKFLADHNVTSHTIAAGILGYLGMYVENEYGTRDFTDKFLAHHMVIAPMFMSAVAIYLRYSRSGIKPQPQPSPLPKDSAPVVQPQVKEGPDVG